MTPRNGTEAERALEKAFAFLERQGRTEAEVRERLVKAGFGEEARDAALAKLIELGYVNDADYAACYVESLIAKGRGRLRIREGLRRKGIPEELARNATEDAYSHARETETALEAARKAFSELPRELIETQPRRAAEKVGRRLVGRGFPYEIIGEVMERIRNE
ncbi:MAG: recombination regulator RecX [Clostridiales bacterium]|nr:recombination regulator RecX [Clostridiales bacterium]